MNDPIETWREVFPHSLAVKHEILGGMIYTFYLGAGPEDWANGISHNDPLSYTMRRNIDGTYSEINGGPVLTVRATVPYMAYSSEKMRKKSNIAPEKLTARFEEVRAWLRVHANEAAFNIGGKLC